MAFHLSLEAGRIGLLSLACILTSACGGGGGDSAGTPTSPAPASAGGTQITRVVVAGDSLADSGTFGFRATVQGAANPATGYPVYPELVATSLGLTAPCSYFSSADEGQSFTTNAGCTNYAVAASAVVNPVTRGGDDVPFSLEHQLETAVAANGGIALSEGPAEAAAFQSQLRQWIAGFNAELARLVAGDPRVALVRYAEDFAAQNASPATFGLTNVTTAACPPGDFPACTDAALDAAPPAGLAPGWWRTWSFSDGFHPSPRAHELLAATVNRALAAAGWR